MTKRNGIDTFYELIAQGCNDPAVYEALLPLPIETLGRAAIQARFPELDTSKLDISKLVKDEILKKRKLFNMGCKAMV